VSPHITMTQTRYEIVSTIGVGATSRVDKAHDTLIDRTVALKTFGHGFGSEELQKQFMREAQILGRLSHPNIVSIYDLGTNPDGSAYLVTEFVPGKTLESVMATQGALPLSRIGVWAGDLANALNRAHRAGIIHGDVKPANIFVTEDGHIKLGDFGIARFATQISGTGKLVGTPAYLSPEQIKGGSQDHRSDIFSLGIILYQLATGVRPFDGSSVAAVCAQIVAAEPLPPSHHNPELPKEFDRVVMRCLAKDPNARYASGESLAASLYPFARSKPEATPNRFDFSWWKRPLSPRDTWIAAGTVSAALLAVLATHQWNQARAAGLSEATADSAIVSVPVPVSIPGNPPVQSSSLQSEPAISSASAGLKEQSSSPEQKQRAILPRTKKNEHEGKPLQSSSKGAGAKLGPVSSPVPVAGANGNSHSATVPGNSLLPVGATHSAASAQIPLSIEIASAIDGETLAVYADQHLVATSSLSITSSGATLHLERLLAAGPHEFRVALYHPDQSLHLERGGLAEIQAGSANVLSIKVIRRAKMLVKHDAALEILWPGALAGRRMKTGDTIADASVSTDTSR
jgi:serine/threonine protein kinase